LFFKRKPAPQVEIRLADLVPKESSTGFVFWDIHDDLGKAVEKIKDHSPMMLMAYGYARRAAMAALYVQGVNQAEDYAYVQSIFKSIQQMTGQTVEFQERAFALSIDFLQTYQHLATAKFVKAVVSIAKDYELPEQRLSDSDLFSAVIETIHQEESAALELQRR